LSAKSQTEAKWAEMNWQEVGFKCGVEIHNRLATQGKLFCGCDTRFSGGKVNSELTRRLRAVAGELGEVDIAAAYEFLKGKTFDYECYPNETCLVETDEEPPHQVNSEALFIALQIAKMLHARIPDEIHFMRKTVIDGSNTSAFQRTALVGMDGTLETSRGPVRIANICLEEESSGIVSKEDGNAKFRLDRLGIPLVEIGTAPDVKDPEHAREVAEKIGMVIRSTGKSQRGIGVTRQDLNVSIKGGARVEIKGVQELGMIPKIIEEEVKRQMQLQTAGQRPREETRLAKADGTTEYMRPLPGGERMYPETDIRPIVLDAKMLSRIELPETWEQKARRFENFLPKDLVDQIMRSEYMDIFEKLSKRYEPILLANLLTSVAKDIRRNGVAIEGLEEWHFEEALRFVKAGKMSKEAVPKLLEFFARSPSASPEDAIVALGLSSISEVELREIIKRVMARNPHLVMEKRAGALMGDVMKEVRGRIDGGTVARVLNEELSKSG